MTEWAVTSSCLILAVLLIRFCLKERLSARLRYGLWLVVLFRLLLPVNVAESSVSVLNLLPEREASAGDIRASWRSGLVSGELCGAGGEEKQGGSGYAAGVGTGTGAETALGTGGTDREKIQWNPPRLPGLGSVLWTVWGSGAVVCGGLFLISNLLFRKKMSKDRRFLGREGIAVYETGQVDTPCLFGLFRPVIFLPLGMREEQEILFFVLCHERTHYRHGDHVWAFLRLACVCLHWYNPLVWIAAGYSRQDGELACDEAVLDRLKEDQRISYGKALIDLSVERRGRVLLDSVKLATTMFGSKRQLRERVGRIAASPHMALGTTVAVAVLLAAVSMTAFTGKAAEAAEGLPAPETDGEEGQGSAGGGGAEGMAAADETVPQNVTKRFPIAIGEGSREYYLELYGRQAYDGRYEIDSLAVGYEEGGEEFPIQTLYPGEDLNGFYGGADSMEVITYASRECGVFTEDLDLDGYEEFGIPYFGEENRWLLYRWRPDSGAFAFAGLYERKQGESGEEHYYRKNMSTDTGRVQIAWVCTEDENGLQAFDREEWTVYRRTEEGQESKSVTLHYVTDFYSMAPVYFAGGTYQCTSEADFYGTADVVYLAGRAVEELWEQTGTWVEECFFTVTQRGDYYFGMTEEDVLKSRTFYGRCYAREEGFESRFSQMSITCRESVWYSPVAWLSLPQGYEGMSDEDMAVWIVERFAPVSGNRVEEVSVSYGNTFAVKLESGEYYEVDLARNRYHVPVSCMVSGPYGEFPLH